MILDGHIHIMDLSEDRGDFEQNLRNAGINGGLIISLPPPAFPAVAPTASPVDRMNNLLSWCNKSENLYPFYWVDPMENDAVDQVSMAVEKGATGFKVICDRFFPGDRKAMKVFKLIAGVNRPILFHSGILWDGKPSSQYNRPSEFEVLLGIPGLKFSLAHISWPWCDELIAVYGKFLNAYSNDPGQSVEMFVDITPGTPPIYRREALTKLFTVGYDIENNIIFGSDCGTSPYNTGWTRQWIERDRNVFQDLGLNKKILEAIYSRNLKRFVGVSSDKIGKKIPRPGE